MAKIMFNQWVKMTPKNGSKTESFVLKLTKDETFIGPLGSFGAPVLTTGDPATARHLVRRCAKSGPGFR